MVVGNLSAIEITNYNYLCSEMTALLGSGTYCQNMVGSNRHSLTNCCQIYPNPASNQCTINVSQIFVGESYSIVDFTGREAISGVFTGENNIIDIENLPDGIYLLRTGTANEYAMKFVKENY